MSLLESCLTVALISTATMIAVPSLMRARESYELEATARRVPLHGNPATAHMFIVHPFRGGGLAKLFSTHPPTEERVERLLEMRGLG